MTLSLLKLLACALVLVMLGGCLSEEVHHTELLDDACIDPDYERPENVYEAQVDFMLRAYYPVSYLNDKIRAELLNSIVNVQTRDARLLSKSWNQLAEHERNCLDQIYDSTRLLDGRRLVLQDNDGDGIKDFRINYYGEFFENDTDADNDGLDNVLDIAPFNAKLNSYEDDDGDGLANHLDWSNSDLYIKNIKQQRIQQRLYEEFGLLLVEGNQNFLPLMVQIIEDVLYRALHSQRTAIHSKDAIKYIFSNQRPYIPINESEYYGSVHSGTRRMYLFSAVFNTVDDEQAHLVTFLTIVHEAIHALQFAMDYPENLVNHLRWNTESSIPNFVAALNALGWSIDLTETAQATDKPYSGFMFNETSEVPFEQYFGEGELRITIGELAELYFSDVTPDKQYGIVNSYSLGNIWEWHAEYVTVSILQRMFETTRKLLNADDYDAISTCVLSKLLDLYGEDYTYKIDQARPDIMLTLENMFPITDDNLTYLAKKFIIKPYGTCSGV